MNYENITRQLQKEGLRLTTARKYVIQVLCVNENYLGAYDIHHILESQGIHIGVASIYRVLAMLDSFDLLQKEEYGSGSERFRINSPKNHAHQLICSSCGRTQEFGDCPLAPLTKNLESKSGYQIKEHWLRFFGLCPHCQAQQNPQH